MKTTKIKVIRAGYYGGAYHEAGAEIELTERQLDCIQRREREFEILEGPDKGKVVNTAPQPAEGASGKPEGGTTQNAPEGGSDDQPKLSVKDLKAKLDDAGVEYPANAKKADLQALVDGVGKTDDAPEGGSEGEDLM